jgi:hypothetical protein
MVESITAKEWLALSVGVGGPYPRRTKSAQLDGLVRRLLEGALGLCPTVHDAPHILAREDGLGVERDGEQHGLELLVDGEVDMGRGEEAVKEGGKDGEVDGLRVVGLDDVESAERRGGEGHFHELALGREFGVGLADAGGGAAGVDGEVFALGGEEPGWFVA